VPGAYGVRQPYAADDLCRAIVENSLQGLAIFQDERAVFANQTMADITGYGVDEILRMTPEQVRAFVHPDDRQTVWGRHVQRLAGEPAPQRYEIRGIRKDGSVCWLEIHATRIDYQGRPAVQVAYVDITDRKQAEQHMRTLVATAMELVELPPQADFLQFTSEKVLALIGGGIVSANAIEGDTLTVRAIAGAKPMVMKLARRLLGRPVTGMALPGVREEVRNNLLTARLVRVEGGLYELFFHAVPRAVCRTLEKATGIKECWSIGLRRPNVLFGSVTILTQKATELNAGLVEAFVSQASIALERRQAEEALRESEARYRSLFEDSVIGISQSLPEGRLICANSAFAHMYGYEDAEAMIAEVSHVGQQLYADPKVRQEVLSILREKGVVEPREVLARRRDGTRFTVLVGAREIRDSRGNLACYQAEHIDITKRKQAEEALRHTRDFAEGIIATAQTVVLVMDPQGRIVRFNPYMEDISGYSLAEVQGKDWFSTFLPERDRERIRALFLKAIGGHQTRGNVNPIVTKDGREREIEWYDRTLKDNAGNVVGLLAVGQDITERERAEQALRESEARFRILFDTAADGLLLRDVATGEFHLANQACLRMLGYTLEEFQRLDIVDLHPEEELPLIRAEMAKFHRGDAGTRAEVRFRQKNGSTFVADLNPTAVRFAGRDYVLVAIRDITERKKFEQRLLDDQAQLRQLATELMLAEERERRRIAVGVHDQIGQRLALIKLTLQSLRASSWENRMVQTLKEVCNDIDQAIEDAHSLTFELSNPVLYEAGFADAVESWLAGQVRERHGIEYTFDADESDAELTKEAQIALFHIVQELLTNVIKHAKAKQVDVRIQRIGDAMRILVRDDGVGFDPSEAGTSVSRAGGFGLFSVRERLEYLGGSIRIDSAPGAGTCIEIRTPLRLPRDPTE
jgi:PAS domain S-box-containing protein